MCHPLSLATKVAMLEVDALMNAPTQAEQLRCWHIAQAACYHHTRQVEGQWMPKNMKKDIDLCYKKLSKFSHFMEK